MYFCMKNANGTDIYISDKCMHRKFMKAPLPSLHILLINNDIAIAMLIKRCQNKHIGDHTVLLSVMLR